MVSRMGIPEALGVLRAVREQLDAGEIRASWPTKHGDVEIKVDDYGLQLFVGGREVPLEGLA